ncbi:cytochrome c biogenesis protein CcdA [soil metagenome]
MDDLTLGVALLAGLISFLSPCVLPVVPAYLGQLGIVALAAPAPGPGHALVTAAASMGPGGAAPGSTAVAPTISQPATSRGWCTLPNDLAFVLGFKVVFTILGVAVYAVAGPLREKLPLLRQVGGVVLIVLGLNLMRVLRLRTLARSWKPLERFGGQGPGSRRGGVVGGFAMGSAFAVGWTPCIGPTLAAILTMAAVGASPQAAGLLVAYSLGLGIPFILLALAVDRAPSVTRFLLRYSRPIEVVGGALVIVLGLALVFDWLGMFSRAFVDLWPQV